MVKSETEMAICLSKNENGEIKRMSVVHDLQTSSYSEESYVEDFNHTINEPNNGSPLLCNTNIISENSESLEEYLNGTISSTKPDTSESGSTSISEVDQNLCISDPVSSSETNKLSQSYSLSSSPCSDKVQDTLLHNTVEIINPLLSEAIPLNVDLAPNDSIRSKLDNSPEDSHNMICSVDQCLSKESNPSTSESLKELTEPESINTKLFENEGICKFKNEVIHGDTHTQSSKPIFENEDPNELHERNPSLSCPDVSKILLEKASTEFPSPKFLDKSECDTFIPSITETSHKKFEKSDQSHFSILKDEENLNVNLESHPNDPYISVSPTISDTGTASLLNTDSTCITQTSALCQQDDIIIPAEKRLCDDNVKDICSPPLTLDTTETNDHRKNEDPATLLENDSEAVKNDLESNLQVDAKINPEIENDTTFMTVSNINECSEKPNPTHDNHLSECNNYSELNTDNSIESDLNAKTAITDLEPNSFTEEICIIKQEDPLNIENNETIEPILDKENIKQVKVPVFINIDSKCEITKHTHLLETESAMNSVFERTSQLEESDEMCEDQDTVTVNLNTLTSVADKTLTEEIHMKENSDLDEEYNKMSPIPIVLDQNPTSETFNDPVTERGQSDSPSKFDAENPTELIPENKFDWDSYLEEINAEAAPPTAFLHVEQSLETGIKEGQCLEVLEPHTDLPNHTREEDECLQEDDIWASYWPAKVTSSCSSLLRIRFFGLSNMKSNSATEFWRDISSNSIKPIGWSSDRNIPMIIPPPLVCSTENLVIFVENELRKSDGVPEAAFCNETRHLHTRIVEGTFVEILDSQNLHNGRICKVRENHGGRLLLEDAVEECSEPFWMFFSDRRIKHLGWIRDQGDPYRYHTSSLPLEEALESNSRLSSHHSLAFLSDLHPLSSCHSVETEMYLEAVHPTTLQSIHVAVVSNVINDTFFELKIDNHTWVTSIDDPLLMPCNFCRDHFLDLVFPEGMKESEWVEHLASVGGTPVPDECFPQRVLGSDVGFEEGQKLEAANPANPHQIGVATIERIVGHLLLLKLELEPSSVFYQPTSSMDIFPCGWAQSNGLILDIPRVSLLSGGEAQRNQSEYASGFPAEENGQLVDHDMKTEKTSSNSMWCPKLYINHFCYPGPYLSKSKVAKMSQSVGPGPVRLVLRDVIGMTINSGYIPTRVLRELQNLHMLNRTWQTIPLKAKFKRHILKASVNIPSTARELNVFLMEFSKILTSCPNLWSHEPVGENCPLACNKPTIASLTNGTVVLRGKGLRGYTWRRKRGGKKRLFYPIKSSATSQDDATDRGREADDDDFCEPDEGFEGDYGLSGSEGESRPPSPNCSDRARKIKQKRMLSALEITMNESRVLDYTKERGTKRSRGDAYYCSQQETRGLVDGTESPQRRKKPRPEDEPPNTIYGLEVADVTSDPLEWSVADVERHVSSQPSIGHHAVKLREQEVDGRALLLLNLPSLVHHLRLPHAAAVSLAQYICKVKMAHFLLFYPEIGNKR